RDGHVTGVQTCALPIWDGQSHNRPCEPRACLQSSRKYLLALSMAEWRRGTIGANGSRRIGVTHRTSGVHLDIPRAPAPRYRRYVRGGIAAGAVVLLTVFLTSLKPAAPTVDRGTLWVDSVRRGEMVREVRGPGTLVPEHIR